MRRFHKFTNIAVSGVAAWSFIFLALIGARSLAIEAQFWPMEDVCYGEL